MEIFKMLKTRSQKVGSVALLIVLSLNFIPVSRAAGITISPPKFEESVNPGETVQKLVKVTNNGDQPVELNVSVQDFVARGEEGQQEYIDPDPENPQPHLLSSWVQYSKEPFTIDPGQIARVPFQISVPENAEPGGHFGTIFFSPPLQKVDDVAIVQRIGSLLLVRVSGEINEQADLDSFKTFKEEIDPSSVDKYPEQSWFEKLPVNFVLRAENTGNVHTKVSGKIDIFNTFGQKLEKIGVEPVLNNRGLEVDKKIVDYIPVNPGGGNILPNSFRSFQQEWNGYPRLGFDPETGERAVSYDGHAFGRYKAVLETEYGAKKTKLPTQEIVFWVIPWKIVGATLAGLIILVILGIAIVKGKRSSKRKIEEEIRKQLMSEIEKSED